MFGYDLLHCILLCFVFDFAGFGGACWFWGVCLLYLVGFQLVGVSCLLLVGWCWFGYGLCLRVRFVCFVVGFVFSLIVSFSCGCVCLTRLVVVIWIIYGLVLIGGLVFFCFCVVVCCNFLDFRFYVCCAVWFWFRVGFGGWVLASGFVGFSGVLFVWWVWRLLWI